MKKYDFIFKIAFINYLLVLIARPYITGRTWADIILFMFIFSCVYQIIYIFYLRKKENLTFLKSIANYFLYLTYIGDVIAVYSFFDAMRNIAGWEMISFLFIGLPIFVICSIYQFMYYIIKKKKSKDNSKI